MPDGKYDIYPTYSPEHWGLYPQFKYNRNGIVDLALIKYVMAPVSAPAKCWRATHPACPLAEHRREPA